MAIITKKRNVCESKSKKYRSRTRKNKSINKKKMRGGTQNNYSSNYSDPIEEFRNPRFNSEYVQPS